MSKHSLAYWTFKKRISMGLYTPLVKYLRDIKTRQSFDLAVIVYMYKILKYDDSNELTTM